MSLGAHKNNNNSNNVNNSLDQESGMRRRRSTEYHEDVEEENSEHVRVGVSVVDEHDASPAQNAPSGVTSGSSGLTGSTASRRENAALSINPGLAQSMDLPPRPRSRPASLRARNRGMSLRTLIFAKNLVKQANDPAAVLELQGMQSSSRPGSSRSTSSKKQGEPSVNVTPIAEAASGSGTDGDSEAEARPPQPRGHPRRPVPRLPSRIQGRAQDYIARIHETWEKARKLVLRTQEMPPSKDGRHIPVDPSRTSGLIDERTRKEFVNNFIRSSKYNAWNFLPRQLFAQFRKLANAYFLVISVLQMIPGLSTTGTYTTIIPLLFFISISMAKEGIEDARRRRLDKEENNRATKVLREYEESAITIDVDNNEDKAQVVVRHEYRPERAKKAGPVVWVSTSWQSLRVGDVVKLSRNDAAPADLVLLSTNGENNIAYVETMALDGETNLKPKQPPGVLLGRCGSPEAIASEQVVVTVEDPNLDLYRMNGRIYVDGNVAPLTNNEIIYRGSVLRNTPEALCMVVYAGEESKIRMNATKNPRIKRPSLQGRVNKIVLGLVFLVLFLAIFETAAYEVWSQEVESRAWYLTRAKVPVGHIIVSFIIMFNTLIPLSLYVSLEIIKLAQVYFLNDIDMYDPESNTPFEARTSTINEELGQVSYIFSDKTGTLTQNVMHFRKLSVAGTAWLHLNDLQAKEAARERAVYDMPKDKGKSRRTSFQWSRTRLTANRALNGSRPSMDVGSQLASPPTTPGVQWKSPAALNVGQPELSTTDMLQYMQRKPQTVFARKAKLMLLSMALCHTCLPERNGEVDSHISYQAASPDELALVDAARDLGYLVFDRAAATLTLKTYPHGVDGEAVFESYQILNVIEFSSKRKRMSVVVRFPDGRICLITKGADSVVTERLRLATLAHSKIAEMEDRVETRKSIEVREALRRKSLAVERKGSMISFGRPSMSSVDPPSAGRPSFGRLRSLRNSIDGWLSERENDVSAPPDKSYYTPRPSGQFGFRPSLAISERNIDGYFAQEPDELVEESLVSDDPAVIERCFQHVNDFATEGLRTLLYGYRFVDEDDYVSWANAYRDAETALVNRQERIEQAAEEIERQLELGGATAIEDELQSGVPETIERLRRANIKMWMLTGDKRETAINIGHSCRLIKDYSDITILDREDKGMPACIASATEAITQGNVAHAVVVVDGQTLGTIESDATLHHAFLDLAVVADSVICCRASPSQKAGLVHEIRLRVKDSVTLAIGDGANDIAMIQEAHVGIGLTGKEGLQAARASDYSIAQFRFLTKLLLVHGRWNYIRTCKYTVGTFWKELMFYLTQALYQRWNGYTGTSLYEQWSLSMFNTLFTSLPVIFLGVFEQDLAPATLVAVPELYTKGQRSLGLNYWVYLGWMFMATSEAMVIFFTMKSLWGAAQFSFGQDLFSNGDLTFTACIVLINTKLQLLEQRNKTYMAVACMVLEVGGWFLWNASLAAIYKNDNEYDVKRGFLSRFGDNALWWVCLLLIVTACVLFEIVVRALKNTFFPTDAEVFAELEKEPSMRQRFEDASAGILGNGNARDGIGDDEIRREHDLDHEREREHDSHIPAPVPPVVVVEEEEDEEGGHDDDDGDRRDGGTVVVARNGRKEEESVSVAGHVASVKTW